MVLAPRIRLALATVVACLFAAVVAIVLAGGTDGGRSPASSGGFAGFVRPPGVPPADFTLRDQDGRTVSLRDLRGQPVVVTFMYSTCEDTCPEQAQTVRGALDRVGVDVPVLVVSVDPANDTPANARRFLAKQRVVGRMRFLVGTRSQLAPVWRQFGTKPQGNAPDGTPQVDKAKFDHSAHIVLLDRDGRQRVGFPVSHAVPEDVAHDLALLLRRN